MPMNRTFMKSMGRVHAALYRLSGGRIAGRWGSGGRVVLLTTTGRKSGEPRVAPLLAMPDGESMIVIASNGGNDTHPAWWRNLQAHPEAQLTVGGETRRVRAETLDDEEKARIWPRIVEMNEGYQGYQDGTSRNIPVVRLTPLP